MQIVKPCLGMKNQTAIVNNHKGQKFVNKDIVINRKFNWPNP